MLEKNLRHRELTRYDSKLSSYTLSNGRESKVIRLHQWLHTHTQTACQVIMTMNKNMELELALMAIKLSCPILHDFLGPNTQI